MRAVTSHDTVPDALRAGTWTLRHAIAEGSFATIYLAEGPGGQKVAVKVATAAHPQVLPRFRREVRVIRRLPLNPFVVRYIGHGKLEDGRPYLVMEHLRGFTLERLLRSGLVLTESAAVSLVAELCQAFVEIHRLGVAHCDVKPANIMLSVLPSGPNVRLSGLVAGPSRRSVHVGQLDGMGMHVKLLDFGMVRDTLGLLRVYEAHDRNIARDFAEELDRGMVAGTPAYMAPEIVTDAAEPDPSAWRTTPAADVFSLGVICYELLAGAPPWPFRFGGDPQSMRRRLRSYLADRAGGRHVLPELSGVSPALRSALDAALSLDPRDRPATASELLAEIRGRSTAQAHSGARLRTIAVAPQPAPPTAPSVPALGWARRLEPGVVSRISHIAVPWLGWGLSGFGAGIGAALLLSA